MTMHVDHDRRKSQVEKMNMSSLDRSFDFDSLAERTNGTARSINAVIDCAGQLQSLLNGYPFHGDWRVVLQLAAQQAGNSADL